MRTTITLHDAVYKALKIRAAQTNETISEIVEDAVKHELLEDLQDREDIDKRKSEPTQTFDSLLTEFKSEGLL